MRVQGHVDVIALACRIRSLSTAARKGAIRDAIVRSAQADAHCRKFGVPHVDFGDGSLFWLASRGGLPAEPALDDRDYCACLSEVYGALAQLPAVQDTQSEYPGSSKSRASGISSPHSSQ